MRIGMTELLLIFGVVLLLFGPKKLPELARSMGQAVKEFKKGQEEIESTMRAEVKAEEPKETVEVASAAKEEVTGDK